jgi:hypothetical protein
MIRKIFCVIFVIIMICLVSIPVEAITTVTVTVRRYNTIGVNNLSLGIDLNNGHNRYVGRSVLRDYTRKANVALIRIWSYYIEPCTRWNENTRSGTWNWITVDNLVNKIFSQGAEPFIVLGFRKDMDKKIPLGMAFNKNTYLPYPASWAKYCAEWVRHFKQKGIPVRFYDMINEPWIGGKLSSNQEIQNYMNVYNKASSEMRKINNNILIGFDAATKKHVLDYWLSHSGARLDFLSFHKYDATRIGQHSIQTLFNRAEGNKLVTTNFIYGVKDAKRIYRSARGYTPLIINGESNMNTAWTSGSDSLIPKMEGAIWTALVLRKGILIGLDYNIYNRYHCSASWSLTKSNGRSVGKGMINTDNNQPYYPYRVYELVGNNLEVGDKIVKSYSSSSSVRTIAWLHEKTLNVLVISKTKNNFSIKINGAWGRFRGYRIDSSIDWRDAEIQDFSFYAKNTFQINGYTVVLLQKNLG